MYSFYYGHNDAFFCEKVIFGGTFQHNLSEPQTNSLSYSGHNQILPYLKDENIL